MKYKEFKINIGDNPALSKAVQEHAFKLGYRWARSGRKLVDTEKAFLFFYHDKDICWGDKFKSFQRSSKEEISIRDFFKLTKDDVIVEPERFHCIFSIIHNPTCEAELTQDKIDIIEAIMQEGES